MFAKEFTMKTSALSSSHPLFSSLIPTLQFAQALLKGSWRDRRGLMTALFAPILMLVMFWLLTGSNEDAEFDLLGFMFPAIIGFSVMFSGSGQAARLLNWREQGVFQRLAATPVPLGNLVLGAFLAQTVLGAIQGTAILLFGIFVVGLPVNLGGALLTIVVLVFGGACFISLGSLVATLATKADSANNLYTFTMLPMFFFGGGFPPEIMPTFVQNISPWLPTTMFTDLMRPLLSTGALAQDSWIALAGLAGYFVLFSVLAAKRFRWEI